MNLENEIWKDVVGYEGLYQVSNLGRVKSLPRIVKNGKIYRRVNERIMANLRAHNGYIKAYLKRFGKGVNKSIHRMVAEAFIPNPLNLPQVNHIDEDKTNNRVENLEWCTAKHNTCYGTRPKRIAAKNSKPVFQFSLDGGFLREFESVKVAAETLKVHPSSIYTCVQGIHSIAYGYKWAYK